MYFLLNATAAFFFSTDHFQGEPRKVYFGLRVCEGNGLGRRFTYQKFLTNSQLGRVERRLPN